MKADYWFGIFGGVAYWGMAIMALIPLWRPIDGILHARQRRADEEACKSAMFFFVLGVLMFALAVSDRYHGLKKLGAMLGEVLRG